MMKILSVGSFSKISNTCLHRTWALRKCTEDVDVIETDAPKLTVWYRVVHHLFLWGLPIRLPDSANANGKIRNYVSSKEYDVVWIDKGLTITPETLSFIKQKCPHARIVSYTADNMALRHNQSQQFLECIPLYDIHFTTKSYILEEMKKLGAKRIVFTNQFYESTYHHIFNLTVDDMNHLGGDVGFIGMWEKERCDSILYLVSHGIKVKVFGGGKWNKYKNVPNLTICPPIFSTDYSKALQAFKISLCFLRKMNFDQQTTRTMEIPGCGGFLLAERTKEHLSLFEEGKEAVFFSSNEELLEKCRYYLSHNDERIAIAKAGHNRCLDSGYSNEFGIKKILDIVMSIKL